MPDIANATVVKQWLQESNKDYLGRKTWENLYASTDIAKQQAITQQTGDYFDAIATAYSATQATNNTIMSSNLGQGFKQAAIDENDVVLEEAYNAYRQNYLKNVATIESNAATQTNAITKELTTQSQMTADYINELPGYLQALYDKYGEEFFNDATLSRYLVDSDDVDANGNSIRRIVNTDELYNMMTEVDENGEIKFSVKGYDIFDQLQNMSSSDALDYSFKDYLGDYENEDLDLTAAEKTQRQDLLKWLDTINPYHYDQEKEGYFTNETLVKIMTDSDDNKYSFLERFGGMTETEINTVVNNFKAKEDRITELLSSGAKEKDVLGAIDDYMSSITLYMKDIGIYNDIEAKLKDSGYTIEDYFNSYRDNIEKYYDDVAKNNWEEAGKVAAAVGIAITAIVASIASYGSASAPALLGASAAIGSLGIGTAVGVGTLAGIGTLGVLNGLDTFDPKYSNTPLTLTTVFADYAHQQRVTSQAKYK